LSAHGCHRAGPAHLYSLEAIGSTLLTIRGAVSDYLDRDKQQRATLSPFLAVAFSIIGLS
jgi:hypothetical protein